MKNFLPNPLLFLAFAMMLPWQAAATLVDTADSISTTNAASATAAQMAGTTKIYRAMPAEDRKAYDDCMSILAGKSGAILLQSPTTICMRLVHGSGFLAQADIHKAERILATKQESVDAANVTDPARAADQAKIDRTRQLLKPYTETAEASSTETGN